MADETTPIADLSPDDAKAEIEARKQDKDFMSDYMDVAQRRDGHKVAVDTMRQLHEAAYPRSGQAPTTTIEEVEESPADEEPVPDKDQAMASLRAQYGGAVEETLNRAKATVDSLGGQELRDLLDESDRGNDPATIRMFDELGRANERMPMIQVLREMMHYFPDSASAAEEIVRLQGDPAFRRVYGDVTGQEPGAHKLAVARMTALFQIKCGVTDLGPPPDTAA